MNKTHVVCGVVVLLTAGAEGQSRIAHTAVSDGQKPIVLGNPPSSPSAASNRQVTPVVPYRYGSSITERIPIGASAVTVLNVSPRPSLTPPPPGMSQVELWTRDYDAVGIFRVRNAIGQLTPQEDWIFSLVQADVVDVLKPDAGGRLVTGQDTLVFRTSGGTVTRGATTVTAISHFVDQVETGGIYLAFLFKDPENDVLRAGEYTLFQLLDSTFRPLDRRGGLDTVLSGPADKHIELIRTFSRLPRVYPDGGVQ